MPAPSREPCLLLPCTINDRLQTHALSDSGCEGFAFVDMPFVQRYNLPLTEMPEKLAANGYDGQGEAISQTTHFNLALANGTHYEVITAYVVPKLHQYSVILGKP